jgi:hypothetical protein
MKYADADISSIPELLSKLKPQITKGEPVWFRGQSEFNWKLTPSVARVTGGIDAEFALVKRFKQNALSFLTNRPLSEWDWLFLMQHYGVPTRLLDWTESPLVALYFAVSEIDHLGEDGALWCLLPKELNVHANYQPELSLELPFFGVDKQLEGYLPAAIVVDRNYKLNP